MYDFDTFCGISIKQIVSISTLLVSKPLKQRLPLDLLKFRLLLKVVFVYVAYIVTRKWLAFKLCNNLWIETRFTHFKITFCPRYIVSFQYAIDLWCVETKLVWQNQLIWSEKPKIAVTTPNHSKKRFTFAFCIVPWASWAIALLAVWDK